MNHEISRQNGYRKCAMMSLLSLLLPLTGESITPSSANCSNNARADIHARGFWGRRQGTLFDLIFDIRVFHPNAPSYRQTRVARSSLFRRHELVECESFTPLVFSTSGGLGNDMTKTRNGLGKQTHKRTGRNFPENVFFCHRNSLNRCYKEYNT